MACCYGILEVGGEEKIIEEKMREEKGRAEKSREEKKSVVLLL